jgi:hypothetical protein
MLPPRFIDRCKFLIFVTSIYQCPWPPLRHLSCCCVNSQPERNVTPSIHSCCTHCHLCPSPCIDVRGHRCATSLGAGLKSLHGIHHILRFFLVDIEYASWLHFNMQFSWPSQTIASFSIYTFIHADYNFVAGVITLFQLHLRIFKYFTMYRHSPSLICMPHLPQRPTLLVFPTWHKVCALLLPCMVDVATQRAPSYLLFTYIGKHAPTPLLWGLWQCQLRH